MTINIAVPGRRLAKSEKKTIMKYLGYNEKYHWGKTVYRENKMFRLYKNGVDIVIFNEYDNHGNLNINECLLFLEKVFKGKVVGIRSPLGDDFIIRLRDVTAINLNTKIYCKSDNYKYEHEVQKNG